MLYRHVSMVIFSAVMLFYSSVHIAKNKPNSKLGVSRPRTEYKGIPVQEARQRRENSLLDVFQNSVAGSSADFLRLLQQQAAENRVFSSSGLGGLIGSLNGGSTNALDRFGVTNSGLLSIFDGGNGNLARLAEIFQVLTSLTAANTLVGGGLVPNGGLAGIAGALLNSGTGGPQPQPMLPAATIFANMTQDLLQRFYGTKGSTDHDGSSGLRLLLTTTTTTRSPLH